MAAISGDLPVHNAVEPLQDANEFWMGKRPDVQRTRYMNIFKTCLAVGAGLAVAAAGAYFSARWISSPHITTEFYGLLSLGLTIPVGIGVPLALGIVVAKRLDWKRYDKRDVAQGVINKLYYTPLDDLPKLKLDRFGKGGVLRPDILKDIKDHFLSPAKYHLNLVKKFESKPTSQDFVNAQKSLKRLRKEWDDYKEALSSPDSIPFPTPKISQ